MALGNPAFSENRIEVRREDHDTEQDLIRDLDRDVGNQESLPAVSFGWALADFIEISLKHEAREDLLYEGREDGGDHEDGEDGVLYAELRVVLVEEGEADEERGTDTQQQLAVYVVGCSPVLLEDSHSDLGELGCEWHGEFAVVVVVVFGMLFAHGVFDAGEFFLDFFGFVAALPDVVPILRGLSRSASADHC